MLKMAVQQGRSKRRGEGVRFGTLSFWAKRERRMGKGASRRAGVGRV